MRNGEGVLMWLHDGGNVVSRSKTGGGGGQGQGGGAGAGAGGGGGSERYDSAPMSFLTCFSIIRNHDLHVTHEVHT